MLSHIPSLDSDPLLSYGRQRSLRSRDYPDPRRFGGTWRGNEAQITKGIEELKSGKYRTLADLAKTFHRPYVWAKWLVCQIIVKERQLMTLEQAANYLQSERARKNLVNKSAKKRRKTRATEETKHTPVKPFRISELPFADE